MEELVPIEGPANFGQPARRAAIVGCDGEVLEQLLLMLDLMGWSTELLNPQNEASDLSAAQSRQGAANLPHQLLFIDADQAEQIGSAVNRSETVVFLGSAPTDNQVFYEGKSIIWLHVPLDIDQLERVIMSAA